MSIRLSLHETEEIIADAWERGGSAALDLVFRTHDGDFRLTCFTADLATAKAYADVIAFARKSLTKAAP